MKRRNFLKTLCVLPAVGVMPTFSLATQTREVGGLEKIISIIQSDKKLQKKVRSRDIEIAIGCAKRMNEIIIESIIRTGVANDRKISTVDVREINDYIFNHYHSEWVELHGDDKGNGNHKHHKHGGKNRIETGFHKVRGNGARTKLFRRNAINSVADGIYHLGFQTHRKNRLLNEDGNANVSFKKVAQWLNALLREDLASGRLANAEVSEVMGDTDTGLDRVITMICEDRGLQQRISIGDMRDGSRNANEMNKLILEAISETNASDGGFLTKQNIKEMNAYLVKNHASRWAELHGDDDGQRGHHASHKGHGKHQYIETGFHKVQSDGAKTRLYGKNAVNKVFDGIYHLGFETKYKHRLVNEDGNKNAKFGLVAVWLNRLLADDLRNNTI